jgi:hypothetical protein
MTVIASLRAGALAALLLPSLALAQTTSTQQLPPLAPAANAVPAPATAQPASPALSAAATAAVDQRVAALKSRLAITPAQEASWDVFAQTMRADTANTDTLFAQRAGGAGTMTAVENMHSYAAIARAYADSTERLSNAFDTLYASLSDSQKHAADELFREQAAAAQKTAPR